MSKQDIEKRLGFAAQGVKAEMAIGSYKQGDRTVTVNGKKYEVLPYQMDFFIKELATLDTPEWRADVVKEYLRRGYIKSTSSRPGVKAEMASGWSGKTAKLNRYGNFAVVAAGEDGYAKGFANRTQAQAFSDKHNLGGVKFPSSGGRSFYVFVEAPKDSESTNAARPGAKAKMSASFIVAEAIFNAENAVRRGDNENAQRWIKAAQDAMDETVVSTGMRSKLEQLVKRYKMSRPGAKAKMALTIYTVGAKNACYEALANLGELAKLASETNSGWDFHVNVMTNHVKDAIARMETKPTQAATDLDKAVDTLGMLKKIEPKRLNDNQKGSFKQLIGYVAKSLRDARANIKVVTTASRPGAKAKMAAEIASDPRDKDFEKLKTLKGVVHQGKGFYIIPNKLMTPERRTKVKRSTQRYELSNMGDLVGWGTNHPNVNDYRLKDWAEAFA